MTFRRTRCSHCKKKLTLERPSQIVHPECVQDWILAEAAKRAREEAKSARAAAKVERAHTRQRKESAKKISELVAEAQDAFNKFIHERDKDQPCISCGATNPPMTSGGQWDAGHFKSRGAFPELRFDEDNCHKQCKSCNGGSGKFAHKARTVSAMYEENLIARIGPERVARLNGPHPVPKLDRAELIELKATYRRKLKELKS